MLVASYPTRPQFGPALPANSWARLLATCMRGEISSMDDSHLRSQGSSYHVTESDAIFFLLAADLTRESSSALI